MNKNLDEDYATVSIMVIIALIIGVYVATNGVRDDPWLEFQKDRIIYHSSASNSSASPVFYLNGTFWYNDNGGYTR